MLTASAPVPVLVRSLQRSGWHDLQGKPWHGFRAILIALANTVDPRSGAGFATANQIADRAGGYSSRWTRHLLTEMESAGLITWSRGGILSGRPEPSWFRINKTALLQLVQRGRNRLDEILTARRERTSQRLKGLRLLTVRPRRSNRAPTPSEKSPRQVHAELTTSLPPKGEDLPAQREEIPQPICAICKRSKHIHDFKASMSRGQTHPWTPKEPDHG